jgi:hypothetical protein
MSAKKRKKLKISKAPSLKVLATRAIDEFDVDSVWDIMKASALFETFEDSMRLPTRDEIKAEVDRVVRTAITGTTGFTVVEGSFGLVAYAWKDAIEVLFVPIKLKLP